MLHGIERRAAVVGYRRPQPPAAAMRQISPMGTQTFLVPPSS
jgi:hypothetical protein